MKIILLLLLVLITVTPSIVSEPVHTTYLWHLQQPIYWPDKSIWNEYCYQTCWESYWLKNNDGNWYSDSLQHPLNNLYEIFSKADRVAAYQFRPKDAVQLLLNLPNAGAQVNYSGCLIENINSLAQEGKWGYYLNWQSNFQQAQGWHTTDLNPRMDITAFTFHHAIAPLIDENALHKEIQLHRYIYEQNFGSNPNYSHGFWPAECAFSERLIQTLVEEGLSWVIVANSHLARTCQNYPLIYGTSGCNIDPPNKADILGPFAENWWSGQIGGRGGTFAVPFCYQAHKAKYVDPSTGIEYKITVIPMSDLLSYMDGYAPMGTFEIDNNIAPYNDPENPCLILLAHDGDNAWGGGYDYYMNSVPNFANAAAAQGYIPTTVEQFLADNPIAEDDVIHVEDGSWVNAENDWGHPQFINWLWPMYNGNYQFDPDGWTEDARNWAVITAAENRVETAEKLVDIVRISKIVYPDTTANKAELAWHFFLPALTSGYMYFGAALDMEIKPTIACNNAVEFADSVIDTHPGVDYTAPTVFIPQRFPYNPGDKGFGPIYGYQEYINSKNFHVWSFIYDVSGLQSVQLKYRMDNDGINSLSNNDNEVYAGGSDVGSWQIIPMTERDFPAGNVTGNSNINFFVLPHYIAKEYYAEITSLADCLIDYYIEAVDNYGNIKKSPIQYVYIGDEDGPYPEEYVNWIPVEPQTDDTLTIFYNSNGPLANVSQLFIHLGNNGWQNVSDEVMVYTLQDSTWKYSLIISAGVNIIDFCFYDGEGNWDNNNSEDWHISVDAIGPIFVMDGELDTDAEKIISTINLECWFAKADNQIYIASTPASDNTDIFIFISTTLDYMQNSPWLKSGNVANWNLYLANEGINGYNNWYDNFGLVESAQESVLEGYFYISNELTTADSIFIAIGEYQTEDYGLLVNQLPEGNGDGNISFDEYFLCYLIDLTKPDNLTISTNENEIILNWNMIPGAVYYKIYESNIPNANFTLFDSTTQNYYIINNSTLNKKFYRVTAVR